MRPKPSRSGCRGPSLPPLRDWVVRISRKLPEDFVSYLRSGAPRSGELPNSPLWLAGRFGRGLVSFNVRPFVVCAANRFDDGGDLDGAVRGHDDAVEGVGDGFGQGVVFGVRAH